MSFRIAVLGTWSALTEEDQNTAEAETIRWIIVELSGPDDRVLQMSLANIVNDKQAKFAPDVLRLERTLIAERVKSSKRRSLPGVIHFAFRSKCPSRIRPEARILSASGEISLFSRRRSMRLRGGFTIKHAASEPKVWALDARQRAWRYQVDPWDVP
ncbi:hypothetical protein [uncultured Tateyamaria sp.]|uniref:hypothetical protein n=1 Tax=uncultured Tateyamaria sp. TaxID=455651 RepID=UPI00260989DA|nr:hypothetical protein [uncultured Tateyamaria sp.]